MANGLKWLVMADIETYEMEADNFYDFARRYCEGDIGKDRAMIFDGSTGDVYIADRCGHIMMYYLTPNYLPVFESGYIGLGRIKKGSETIETWDSLPGVPGTAHKPLAKIKVIGAPIRWKIVKV